MGTRELKRREQREAGRDWSLGAEVGGLVGNGVGGGDEFSSDMTLRL